MGHEEDRDRKFEQALARHLREQDDARGGAPDLTGACPDSEVLATFHERMLASEEMNSVKEHVAACSRCQQILAHLETTDMVQLRDEEERVLEVYEPILAGHADREKLFAQAAAPAAVASVTTELKAPQSISSGRGGNLLRWVAPAGAIAAGLLIWAVVRDKPREFAPVQNIEVAQQRAEGEQAAIPQAAAPETNLRSDRAGGLSRVENRKLRPSQELGTRSLPAEEQSQMTDRLSKDGRNAGGAAGGMVAGRLATEKQGRADKYLRDGKPPTPPKSMGQDDTASASAGSAAAADARQSGDEQTKNLPAMGRNEVVLSPEAGAAKKAPARERDMHSKERLEPGVAVASPAPSAPPAPVSENAAVQNATGAPLQPEQKKDADSKVNTEVVATAQAEVSGSYARTSASLKGKAADDSKIILTPGGTALWRLRPAGIIERSEDRGLTWSRQESGTTRELLAGSGPSDVVCWIVGRSGLILRTTDGGGHWEKVTAPVAGELASIRATDALHATILDRGGRAKFATSDGGVNWQRVKE